MYQPVTGRSVWTRADAEKNRDWIVRVEPAEVAELHDAVERSKQAGWELLELTPLRFPLPLLGQKLAAISNELEHGRGMVQMRGLPVLGLKKQDLLRMYWGLGTYLGTGLLQSGQQDHIAEVTDLAVRGDEADARAYRSKGTSRFHFDWCDVVGLLCVKPAKSGGESRVVSAAAVHNEVLRRRPDLMPVLYGDFYHSRQGERTGERPWFKIPLFSRHHDSFSGMLSFLYIESAQRYPEVPRLTDVQKEALACVSEVCQSLYVESALEPGDLQLLNNHSTWHARADYEDHVALQDRRLLYRLWLSTAGSRELPDGFRDFWGHTGASRIRGGVANPEGRRHAGIVQDGCVV